MGAEDDDNECGECGNDPCTCPYKDASVKQAAGSNSGEDDDRGVGDVWREFYYSRYEGLPGKTLMDGMAKEAKWKVLLRNTKGTEREEIVGGDNYSSAEKAVTRKMKPGEKVVSMTVAKLADFNHPEEWRNISNWMSLHESDYETMTELAEAASIQFHLADNGSQIPEEVFEIAGQIFEEMGRADKTADGSTTITMQNQNATIPGTNNKAEPMAVPDAIDQQPGPHSPNAPSTAPRTPSKQPRIVDVPEGTVGDDASVVASEDADWESMHLEENAENSVGDDAAELSGLHDDIEGEEYPDVSCARCSGDRTEIDELPDGGYSVYCEDCGQVTSTHPGEGGSKWHGPEMGAPKPGDFTKEENDKFVAYMKSLGASSKFASLPGAGQKIDGKRMHLSDLTVVLAEDWIIYASDRHGKMWYWDTEVWPEWSEVENAMGIDKSKPQPTVEVMIPYADQHPPRAVRDEQNQAQMTLEQFMEQIKEPGEMEKQGADDVQEGKVDKIQFTNNGYQLTTIGGVQYATLWDAAELPVEEGATVVYTVSGNVEGYKDTPFAEIHEVKSSPQAQTAAVEKVQLECNECHKNFKVSPNAADPQCPRCGSVDWDVKTAAAPVAPAVPAVNPNVAQQQALHQQLQMPQQPGGGASVAIMPGQEEADEPSIGRHTVEPELPDSKYHMQGALYHDEEARLAHQAGLLNSFLVKFDDGNSLVTDFNGSLEDAQQYYIGQWFNVGGGEDDNMVKGESVEQVG